MYNHRMIHWSNVWKMINRLQLVLGEFIIGSVARMEKKMVTTLSLTLISSFFGRTGIYVGGNGHFPIYNVPMIYCKRGLEYDTIGQMVCLIG